MPVTKERWRELCRQAATEKDPQKLAALNQEISAIISNASRGSLPDQPGPKSKSAAAG
jgi:hypothetical protein